MMSIHNLHKLSSIVSQNTRIQTRSFFYWLTIIFNRVDHKRIKEVGPDLACAEWLLKNGAYVRWKGHSEPLTDYNVIPSEGNGYYIEAVDANNAGISYIGFPYFEGCKHINEVKLENCRYINNRAMSCLSLLKDTLTDFKLIKCKAVDDEGLRDLKVLKNLKALTIQDLPYIREKNSIRKELIEALPNCRIDFQ